MIVYFQAEYGSVKKPEEIFHIMEHFCLGRRRIHLFGTDDTIRPGTVLYYFVNGSIKVTDSVNFGSM